MNEEKVRSVLATNLIEYRKLHNLTQIELGEKLNYSDKAVSKWERGESVPDIYVLVMISNLYGITVNDLLSEKKERKKPRSGTRKFLTALISAGLVWLLATIVYVFLALFHVDGRIWLTFIYAIPSSMIIFLVFSAIWKKKLYSFLSGTTLIWTLALSFHLSLIMHDSWLFYIIAIPVQILLILWFMLIRSKK